MSHKKPSLRIDWFDGTLVEDVQPSGSSQFADEDIPAEPPAQQKFQTTEKKPIGFKRLLDISQLKQPILTVEVSHRPGFWNLLDVELKGDFIVLIVKILADIYNSLEVGEKSKIMTLLKTRFEKSDFLKTLKEYIIGLPGVRVVEKRMNSHLWDDIQSFYFNVVSLCDGIVKLGGTSEYMKEILLLLDELEASVIRVREEHMETFNENLFTQIAELKLKVLQLIDKNHAIEKTSPSISGVCKDNSYFKNLHILPTKDDLVCQNQVEIKPNIVNGAYCSVEHYLDLQFKLLREDCFAPLREGICKYLENPSKRRHENIRVYPKVRIIRDYVTNNRVGHLIDVAWKERSTHGIVDSKKYAYNKQLMFGSLLLFTSDNFENILCATVLNSNLDLLKDGYIAVSLHNPVSKNIFSVPYLMVESEVFFEPYHCVLKVLQNSRIDDLPMKKYIVDVQKETNPPAYLTPETLYTIQETSKINEIIFSVLNTENWPDSASIGLDNSQMEAFKFALTREFAVIQGPPGTGKTHIGIKIASTLLKNLSLEGTPMLIICYTNHALDQFLEDILSVTTNVVRLGSQSKSKILEPYNLNYLRSKVKSKYSYLYSSKRRELERIYKKMLEIQTEIEKCEKEIISYKSIRPYLEAKKVELKVFKEDPVLNWLFGHLEGDVESSKDDDLDDWEKQFDDVNSTDENIETCFSEECALKEIASMQSSMKYIRDITDDHMEGQKMTDKFEGEISKIRKRLNYYKNRTAVEQNGEVDVKVLDPYKLKPEDRWNLYFQAVKDIKDELQTKMNVLLEEHNKCSDELEEVSTVIDGEVVRTARVVAVTTTTAARRHDLMKMLHSPIVIVEEAAEVLEAHIVASLTNKCQHLILIGDHKQLRPSTAHYRLAKDYNLEISLFERMIRNGIHVRTLTTQRRMRPNIASLLVPHIYERLDNHPDVFKYPNVKGMKDNLYFCCHDVLEDSEGLEDSWSHKNTLEAMWCASLANYLRHMNYSAQDVTILTTYTGQATLIRNISKKYELLKDVKITVVDSYQGEENRIVILSLVRSNKDGKIGFLAAPNRICVALSRAKEGFYIFGNMNILKSSSTIWRHINDKLVAQNAIGKALFLRCDKHTNNIIEVNNTDEMDDCLSGLCLKVCEKKKP